MNSLAIIPARGGSKRLQNKNIIDFHGTPIISYTINAALKSKCFDRIVISTDDKEIFKTASKFHNDVVYRPKYLATSNSTINDVCYNFLINENRYNNVDYDFLTVLYPTAPMRDSNDIRNVFNKLKYGRYTSAIAATTFSLPVHQSLVLQKKFAKKVFPKLYDLRQNNVTNFYVDNGSTYSTIVKSYIKKKNLITNKLGLYIMPPERSIDIDNSFQLELAKYFFKKGKKN